MGEIIMIGSHNSFTYQKATNPIVNLFKFMWRCQNMDILGQQMFGVKYFDIRVKWDKKLSCWRTCHGLASFDITFDTIKDIIDAFSKYNVRIILERNNDTAVKCFIQEINSLGTEKPDNLRLACIKKNWQALYSNDFTIKDYTYIPWYSGKSFWENIKALNFFSTIKKWAKKHNIVVDNDNIDNTDVVHFMDYVDIANS